MLRYVLMGFGFWMGLSGLVSGAEPPVGTVQSAVPDAQAVHADGTEEAAAPGTALHPGDRLITGGEGRITLILASGGIVTMGPETEAAVDEYSESDADAPPAVRLMIGVVSAVISGTPQGGNMFEVHTPAGVVGVRGTSFDAAVGLDASTAVIVDEGEVMLLDEDNRTTPVSAGRMAEWPPDGNAPSVRTAPAGKMRDWPAWRKERADRLIPVLPQTVGGYKARFDLLAGRFERSAEKIATACAALSRAMDGSQKTGKVRKEKIAPRIAGFRISVLQARRLANRSSAIAGHCRNLSDYIQKNPSPSLSDQTMAMNTLHAVLEKSKDLDRISRNMAREVRRTLDEIRRFERQTGEEAPPGRRPPAHGVTPRR